MPGTSDEPRIYGEADADNRQSAPEQGYRGEQSAAKPLRTDLTHDAVTSSGAIIAVQEQSGTAFAETTGKADGEDRNGPVAPQAD